MKSKAEVAREKFLEGYNCAQSVFYSFCEDLRFNKDLALKMASGFGGGMGLKKEVCGAVTGGIIVIGAKIGRGENQGPGITQETYSKTEQFMDLFSEKHGTFICRELLGDCDFTTEEGRKRFRDKDARMKTCKVCVEDAVNILEAILD